MGNKERKPRHVSLFTRPATLGCPPSVEEKIKEHKTAAAKRSEEIRKRREQAMSIGQPKVKPGGKR